MWILLFLAYGFEFCQVPDTCPLPFEVYKPLIISMTHNNYLIQYALNLHIFP